VPDAHRSPTPADPDAVPDPDPDDGRGPDPHAIDLPGETPEERRDRLRRAAYAAELATGRRERTGREARRNIVARLAIISAGTLVTILGLLMLVLPGPGIVVVIAGLGILATEVAWAERLLAYAKRKARIDKVTSQAPWVKPVAMGITVVAVVVSVAYAIRWR
jgi:uncharacterized protein (TIGR02611 family)